MSNRDLRDVCLCECISQHYQDLSFTNQNPSWLQTFPPIPEYIGHDRGNGKRMLAMGRMHVTPMCHQISIFIMSHEIMVLSWLTLKLG